MHVSAGPRADEARATSPPIKSLVSACSRTALGWLASQPGPSRHFRPAPPFSIN
jgi:hypothetical protein